MVGSTNPVEVGWFDKLKNSLQFNKLAEKLNFSKHKILDMALFFGIGFLSGFLWKRYATYFIAALIFVAVLILLNQLDLITININWIKLQECCGVEPARADADILAMIWDWSKNNILIIFSFIIGFCFGAKVS
jgi:FUN14 family protein